MLFDTEESKFTGKQHDSSKYLNIFIVLYISLRIIERPLLVFNKA
ncbi:hypothetical protein HMPREF1982_02751 [Clostridiales bacterium oral taxon 876 str. F0540]|nr:hypothetical protein HMPREF1982_02751 [Clostridiales bacterium oral taxon 876 str. F0540]